MAKEYPQCCSNCWRLKTLFSGPLNFKFECLENPDKRAEAGQPVSQDTITGEMPCGGKRWLAVPDYVLKHYRQKAEVDNEYHGVLELAGAPVVQVRRGVEN